MKKLIFILFIALFAVSCNRDDDALQTEQQEEKFDINNPVGYSVVYKNSGMYKRLEIYTFLPANKIQIAYAGDKEILDYIIEGQSVKINPQGVTIQVFFDNQMVTNITKVGTQLPGSYYLVNHPEKNELLGTTYTGFYKDYQSNDVHTHFFYQFHTNENKVDAGLNLGNVIRTDNYESIGNFAALVSIPNPDDPSLMDKELLILLDNKLEANYNNLGSSTGLYHGTFTKQ